MKTHFWKLLFFISIVFSAEAQPVRLKFPRQINIPNYNHYAPSISADGLTMLFASDYFVTDGNKVDLKVAYNKGGENWSSGEEVTMINKSGPLNLYGAHCISSDANTIYFTSKKTGGVGGFDIWLTEKKGGSWSVPQNLGKPINTEEMEGFPSESSDGKYLFFVRCQTMSNQGCEDCKLLMAEHKGQGIFKEPITVSEKFAKTSILAPKIAKDGNTLIFSAKQTGGKGGYDMYISRKTGGNWSEPKNMDFLNTPDDDKYADFTSQGDAIIYSSYTDGFLTLYKAKVAEEFQPSKILLVTGKALKAPNQATNGYLQISDNTSGAPISISRIDVDGKFSAVLPVGNAYDVAVTSGNENFFWSTTFDASKLSKSRKEDAEALVLNLKKGELFHSNKAIFDSTNFQFLNGASLEIKRLSKVISSHPDWKFEIVLYLAGISNNPPSEPETAFEQMKTTMLAGLAKAGITAEKITVSNGNSSAEEANNYSGWALKILP